MPSAVPSRETTTSRGAATLSINGRQTALPEPATVGGALDALGLGQRPVAVELNGRLVRRSDHPNTPLAPGDQVEIVTFVGGG